MFVRAAPTGAQAGHALGLRVSPTEAFAGPSGGLAERLVGDPSPDFRDAHLDAHLDARIARAWTRIAGG